jgi:hypothetical protein
MDLVDIPVPLTIKTPAIIGVVLISLLGVFSILLITHLGIGVSPDSVAYIGGARSILAGHGFSFPSTDGTYTPITHFAPFYSVLLSIGGIVNIDPIHVARWVNSLLFGANIISVGMIVLLLQKQASHKIAYLHGVASGLIFLSAAVLEIHRMAWTEPIFIFLGLLGFYLLSLHVETSRPVFLLLSALALSLAALSRYVGLTLIASGVVGLVFFSPATIKKRLLNTILFAMLAAGPLLVWMFRNFTLAGTATSREIAFHPFGKTHLEWALTTLSSWLLVPASADAYIKIVPLLLIVSGFVAVLINKARTNTNLTKIPFIIKLFVIFIPVYGLFLVISITFIDANTPLDSRILSPIFVAGLIITMYTLGELYIWVNRWANTRYLFHGIFLAISGVFLFSYLTTWIEVSRDSYRNGIGYNSLVWKNSLILARVRQLPSGETIYSNSPEAVYIGTGRVARSLPRKFESMTQTENSNFLTELAEINQDLMDQGGVIVYFDRVQRPTLPSKSDLTALWDLELLFSSAEGGIFTINATD